jgi:hypothetical protein
MGEGIMYNHAKYLIIKDGGLEQPIVFPNTFTHSDVARRYGYDNIISAGFVSFGDVGSGDVGSACYGKSVSLGIGGERIGLDAELIDKYILGRI